MRITEIKPWNVIFENLVSKKHFYSLYSAIKFFENLINLNPNHIILKIFITLLMGEAFNFPTDQIHDRFTLGHEPGKRLFEFVLTGKS